MESHAGDTGTEALAGSDEPIRMLMDCHRRIEKYLTLRRLRALNAAAKAGQSAMNSVMLSFWLRCRMTRPGTPAATLHDRLAGRRDAWTT